MKSILDSLDRIDYIRPSDIPGIEIPQSTEGYAKITINDKISITAPTVSDDVKTVQSNHIQDVDLVKTKN